MKGICQLCLQEKKLIDAHIIPFAFFKGMISRGDMPREFEPREHRRSTRRPKGPYDPGILCESCERQFSSWDTYATTFLKIRPQNRAPASATILPGKYLETGHYEYAPLKLFALAVLWRAHVSSKPFFSQTNIGPFAESARQMIVAAEPGSVHDFSVRLTGYIDLPTDLVLPPSPMRGAGGLAHYYFLCGHYEVAIKVDSRVVPQTFVPQLLSPTPPFYLELASVKAGRLATILKNHFGL